MDGILWATHSPLNAEALDAAGPQLKSVSTMSSGLDYIDVAEVKRRKIALGYTPLVLNNAVADIAVGLLIAAGRRFHEGRRKIET
jgi:glyoxylate/hydroxypyruvate reductase